MGEKQREPVSLRKRTDQEVCVYCRGALEAEPWRCPRCEVALHADCAAELDRCPSLGCEGAGSPVRESEEAPWRIRDPGFSNLFVSNNRGSSRVGFTIHEPVSAPGRDDLMRRLAILILPLLLAFGLSYAQLKILGWLAAALWALGVVWLMAAKPKVAMRRRSLTILARPDAWEWIELVDGVETRSLTLPRDGGAELDGGELDKNILKVAGESFRLSDRPGAQQRLLFYELQRAWLGAEPEGPLPRHLGVDNSNLMHWRQGG